MGQELSKWIKNEFVMSFDLKCSWNILNCCFWTIHWWLDWFLSVFFHVGINTTLMPIAVPVSQHMPMTLLVTKCLWSGFVTWVHCLLCRAIFSIICDFDDGNFRQLFSRKKLEEFSLLVWDIWLDSFCKSLCTKKDHKWNSLF